MRRLQGTGDVGGRESISRRMQDEPMTAHSYVWVGTMYQGSYGHRFAPTVKVVCSPGVQEKVPASWQTALLDAASPPKLISLHGLVDPTPVQLTL